MGWPSAPGSAFSVCGRHTQRGSATRPGRTADFRCHAQPFALNSDIIVLKGDNASQSERARLCCANNQPRTVVAPDSLLTSHARQARGELRVTSVAVVPGLTLVSSPFWNTAGPSDRVAGSAQAAGTEHHSDPGSRPLCRDSATQAAPIFHSSVPTRGLHPHARPLVTPSGGERTHCVYRTTGEAGECKTIPDTYRVLSLCQAAC